MSNTTSFSGSYNGESDNAKSEVLAVKAGMSQTISADYGHYPNISRYLPDRASSSDIEQASDEISVASCHDQWLYNLSFVEREEEETLLCCIVLTGG
jgi:hypothetical protein